MLLSSLKNAERDRGGIVSNEGLVSRIVHHSALNIQNENYN